MKSTLASAATDFVWPCYGAEVGRQWNVQLQSASPQAPEEPNVYSCSHPIRSSSSVRSEMFPAPESEGITSRPSGAATSKGNPLL